MVVEEFINMKHTEETKRKIKEHNAKYWLGKKRPPLSEQHRKNLAKSLIGNQHTKGMKFPNRQKPSFDTEERKRKISEAFTGEKHPNWKGGGLRFWMLQAKVRDNYTCQICGNNDKDVVEADHILAKKLRPDLAKELSNLLTLCANCHKKKTKRDMEQIYILRYSNQNE